MASPKESEPLRTTQTCSQADGASGPGLGLPRAALWSWAAADGLPLRLRSRTSLQVWTYQASTIMRAKSLKHVLLAVLHTLLVLFLCRALTGTDGAGPGGSGEGARARLLVQKLSLAAPQGAKALEETHVGRGLGSPAHSEPSEREPSPSAPQGPPPQ